MVNTANGPVDGGAAEATTRLLPLRLGIGLAQGLCAWLLLELMLQANPAPHVPQGWPYRHPALFAVLTLLTAFVPVVALAEAGRMRGRKLGLYLLALAVLLAGFAGYDIWRDPLEDAMGAQIARVWPSATLICCGGIAVFIVNQLLEHRERGHGLWQAYATHFSDSWMRGFQFVLALVFTALVWGVLELGQALFDLIHLDWFGHMIAHNWFRCPVLAVAFAASVHITDVRPALLHGMRNLGLTLLAWLLPLIVVLGLGFLLALAFTGLAPLWATRFAATILLWAVAVTLVLVNAAYKDGDPLHAPPAVIRWAGRAAGPMMLVLTGLAIYAIGQRVWQYGWTPMRLRSAMVAAIALLYAAGYSAASVRKGAWLKGIEPVNVLAGLGIVAVVVLKLSPIADPDRISVNSQLARLTSGRLAPEAFDYQFLRFAAGRYGTEALTALAHGPRADIAARARLAMATPDRSFFTPGGSPDPSQTEPPLAHASVYPRGTILPESFRQTRWRADDYNLPDCFRNGSPCDIILLPRSVAKGPLLLVIEGLDKDDTPPTGTKAVRQLVRVATGQNSNATVYGQDAAGHWDKVGDMSMIGCAGVRAALRQGEITAARPLHDDLIVHGLRLSFTPEQDNDCPAQPAAPARPPAHPADPSAPTGMGPAFGQPAGL